MRMLPKILRDRFPHRAGKVNARELAEKFGVSIPTMDEFLYRFAPDRVPEDRYKADSDTMLFVHIPKTAGVSVGKSLQQAFDTFHSIRWDDIPRSFRQATRAATYAQSTGKRRQALMGHFGWREIRIWLDHRMPVKCGTIFRDPVARLVSNYNYNCSASHPDHQAFKNNYPTLMSYAEDVPLDVQLTQAIGLFESSETALKKLSAHYTFLGTTEFLSDSLRHLSRSHGLVSLSEYRMNVGADEVGVRVAPALRKIVEDRSQNDLKIHRLVSQLYSQYEFSSGNRTGLGAFKHGHRD